MHGFSMGLMKNIMTAGTAMNVAQANTSAISRMESRKQTLEAEIASGYGDVEGKQTEIAQIDERTARAKEMQQNALENANSGMNGALTAPEDETKTADAGDKDEGRHTLTEKAKDKAGDLQERLRNHDLVAVDYRKGMHIENADGRTSVAVSPQFLEKLSADAGLRDIYAGHMATMQTLEEEQVPQVESQVWTVSRDGLISRYVTAAADTSDEDLENIRQKMQTAAQTAFGSLFNSTHMMRYTPPAPADPAASGLLVDTAV